MMRLEDLPKKKARASQGSRAFTDEQEDLIVKALQLRLAPREEIASRANVSMRTLDHIQNRYRERHPEGQAA